MKQEVLKNWDLPMASVTALMIFVICFAAYAYWTFKASNKKVYEEASNIPLGDANLASPAKKGNVV